VLFGDEGMFVRSHISSVSTMHSFGYIIINIFSMQRSWHQQNIEETYIQII